MIACNLIPETKWVVQGWYVPYGEGGNSKKHIKILQIFDSSKEASECCVTYGYKRFEIKCPVPIKPPIIKPSYA